MTDALAPPLLPNLRAAVLPLPAEGLIGRAGELDGVAGAVERRRQQFVAGRACAHAALAAIGREVATVARAESGAPCWPEGVVGSVGHCDAAAIAVVADETHWLALGVDIEPYRPLPDDVAAYALTPVERARFGRSTGGIADWGLIAFCAKECVHKCVHPRSGAFLDFNEVEIMFGEGDCFTPLPRSAAARAALAGARPEGRWRRYRNCLIAVLGFAAVG